MNDRIKVIRKEAGLSQEAFGEKIGVGKTAISKIEKGENSPSEQTIKSICREFNVNYALSCIDFEPMFNVTENDVNSVVMNGYSTETKTHDFFSTKGNGYIKTTKVEDLTDEDFEFNF